MLSQTQWDKLSQVNMTDVRTRLTKNYVLHYGELKTESEQRKLSIPKISNFVELCFTCQIATCLDKYNGEGSSIIKLKPKA